MKLTCEKSQLSEIINTVQRSIASKSTMPILECIKIETVSDGYTTVTGTNLDLYIEYNAEFDIEEGGSIALESKMFGEIVRRLPDGSVTITVNPQNNITKIQSGASEFNIQGLSANEYPSVPVLDEKFRFSLNHSVLKNLIRKTTPFISLNEGKRPVLTGALFEIKNNILNVVASDGHRLAAVKEELKENVDDNKFVIPGNTLRELLKILKDDEEAMIDIIVSDRNVLLDFKNFQVYTRLLDGDFLKYDAILSAVNTIEAEVNKNAITSSLERALLLINDDISAKSENKVPVRFSIGFDKIDVSCVTGKGQVSDSVGAKVSGENIVIGFNCRFLLDAFAVCDSDVVKMEFSSPRSGCFIRDMSEKNSYIYMILPVRLYD